MKKWLGVVACLGFMALPASAQFKADAPSFEVGGGFAYRSFNGPSYTNTGYGVTEPRMGMNGWFATVDYNFNGFLGVTTDVDWTRADVPNDPNLPGTDTLSTVMVGPQIYPIGHHRITPFGHVEFGLAHFSWNVANVPLYEGCGTEGSDVGPCTLTDGSFALGVGGGVDLTLMKAFAVRVGEFDWEQTRMFEPGPAYGNTNQNNWKVKAGIIIRFGGK